MQKVSEKTDCASRIDKSFFHPSTVGKYINLMSKEVGYWKRGYKRAKKKLENENDDAEGMEKK